MLGLCMIVKDAASTIERALKSVIEYCQQLVVVDTGSNDDTTRIAARLGAELHFHSWRGDFAEARNYALKFMRTEWIIILDSDEELERETYINNQKFFDDERIGGINVIIRNYLGENLQKGITEHRYTRIFRNNPKIRFFGSIHEQVRDSIENLGYLIAESDIIINHYGYKQNSETKAQRNIQLLEKELQQNPDEIWYKYHLAESLFSARNLEDARKNYQEVLNSDIINNDYIELIRIRLAQISLNNDEFDNVSEYLAFNSNNMNVEGFRLFIKAGLLMSQKKFEEAFELYKSELVRNSMYIDKSQLDFILSKEKLFRL